MSKLLKTTGGLLLTMVLLLSMSVNAFAAKTTVDWNQKGSISITPKDAEDGHTVIKGTSFTLYKAAEVTNDGTALRYTLAQEFAGSGADLSDVNADGLAKTLADFAEQEGLAGSIEKADENGTVTFADLSLGLYLLVQTGTVNGAYAAEAFLVSIPMTSADGEAWLYDVEASPKAETYELIDVTVKKVWNDGGDIASRPSSVTIQLYDGAALMDTVTLNGDNRWTYTWTGLKKSDGYSVAEAEVSGYAAAYSRNGSIFTVTNSPKLVMTGQLNWPIPLLAGCGLVLFAVGWGLVFLRLRPRNGGQDCHKSRIISPN